MKSRRKKDFEAQLSKAEELEGKPRIWDLPDSVLDEVGGGNGLTDFSQSGPGGFDFAQGMSCFGQGIGDFSQGGIGGGGGSSPGDDDDS